MIFIIILVIVFVVIYNKKKTKEQEQARAENIMQGSEFQPIDDSSSINNAANPFIDNTNTNAPVNNDIDYQSNAQELFNPFTDSNLQENSVSTIEAKENGYDFPYCPVDDKSIPKSRIILGKLSYNNRNYVAISYNSYFGDLILFQEVIVINGKTNYCLVNYGYLWLKLFYIYKENNHGYFGRYANLEDIPMIPEDELENFLQVELSVRELSNEIKSLVLSYDGINNNYYWQYGTVDLGGNSYALLVAQNNIEDTSIHKVTENENGGFTYTLVTDVSLQRMIMNAYDKKNK